MNDEQPRKSFFSRYKVRLLLLFGLFFFAILGRKLVYYVYVNGNPIKKIFSIMSDDTPAWLKKKHKLEDKHINQVKKNFHLPDEQLKELFLKQFEECWSLEIKHSKIFKIYYKKNHDKALLDNKYSPLIKMYEKQGEMNLANDARTEWRWKRDRLDKKWENPSENDLKELKKFHRDRFIRDGFAFRGRTLNPLSPDLIRMKGKVIDQNGEGVPGAKILCGVEVVTDKDGYFLIEKIGRELEIADIKREGYRFDKKTQEGLYYVPYRYSHNEYYHINTRVIRDQTFRPEYKIIENARRNYIYDMDKHTVTLRMYNHEYPEQPKLVGAGG